MSNKNHLLQPTLAINPVIPVLVIERTEDALPIAQALLAGGLRVLEITLRTANALEVIREISVNLPGGGGGGHRNHAQAMACGGAGRRAVRGLPRPDNPTGSRGGQGPVPLLPGVATASELMAATDSGFECFKLFPAQQIGGVGLLKALGGPFPNARFCPTGGITPDNAPSYLALPNVACVGGSWLAPSAWVQDKNWAGLTELARQACALGGTLAA